MNETRAAGSLVSQDPLLDLAVRKATRALVPFLLLLYVLAFLDRVNVGYAKEALLRSTNITETVFAFGASVFFIGYAVFEIPSNLMLHRFGARKWLARIMVTWGLASAAMVFAKTAALFYLLRFLLGVAEAGFFPGVILYLASWFPAHKRGPIMGLFYFGAPIAQIMGGPLSGLLLELEGRGGLHGWQWMFLVEGFAAVIVGIWTFNYLPDSPAKASWLQAAERSALQLAAVPQNPLVTRENESFASMLWNPRILYFGFIYALIQISVYGVTFYLPSHVARLLGRETGFIVGLVSAVPWLCALISAYALPRVALGTLIRPRIASAALVISSLGIAASSSNSPIIGLIGLCFATAGFIGVQPIFWTFPTEEFFGSRAAAALAFINSLGALGGFVAPNLKRLAETTWASPSAGQFALSVTTLCAATAILFIGRSKIRLDFGRRNG